MLSAGAFSSGEGGPSNKLPQGPSTTVAERAGVGTALLLGCPFHVESGVFLDRLYGDFDCVARYASWSKAQHEDPNRAATSTSYIPSSLPFGCCVDARRSLLDGSLTSEQVLARMTAFLQKTYNLQSSSKNATAAGTTSTGRRTSQTQSQPEDRPPPWRTRLLMFGGHGREDSGDWILADGDLSFQRFLLALLEQLLPNAVDPTDTLQLQAAKREREVLVLLDACYSGIWVRKLHQIAKLIALIAEWENTVRAKQQDGTEPRVRLLNGEEAVLDLDDAEILKQAAAAATRPTGGAGATADVKQQPGIRRRKLRPPLVDLLMLEREGADQFLLERTRRNVFKFHQQVADQMKSAAQRRDAEARKSGLEKPAPHIGVPPIRTGEPSFAGIVDEAPTSRRPQNYEGVQQEVATVRPGKIAATDRFRKLRDQRERMFGRMNISDAGRGGGPAGTITTNSNIVSPSTGSSSATVQGQGTSPPRQDAGTLYAYASHSPPAPQRLESHSQGRPPATMGASPVPLVGTAGVGLGSPTFNLGGGRYDSMPGISAIGGRNTNIIAGGKNAKSNGPFRAAAQQVDLETQQNAEKLYLLEFMERNQLAHEILATQPPVELAAEQEATTFIFDRTNTRVARAGGLRTRNEKGGAVDNFSVRGPDDPARKFERPTHRPKKDVGLMTDGEFFAEMLLLCPGSLFHEDQRDDLASIHEKWCQVFPPGGTRKPSSSSANSRIRLCFQSACASAERAFDGVFLSSWLLVQKQELASHYALKHFAYLGKHPLFYVVQTTAKTEDDYGDGAVAAPDEITSNTVVDQNEAATATIPLKTDGARTSSSTTKNTSTMKMTIDILLSADGTWRTKDNALLVGTHAEQSQPAFLAVEPDFLTEGGTKDARRFGTSSDGSALPPTLNMFLQAEDLRIAEAQLVQIYAGADSSLPMPLPKSVYQHLHAEQIIQQILREAEFFAARSKADAGGGGFFSALQNADSMKSVLDSFLSYATNGTDSSANQGAALDHTEQATWSMVQFLYMDSAVRDVGSTIEVSRFIRTLLEQVPSLLGINTLYLLVARLPNLALFSLLELDKEIVVGADDGEDAEGSSADAARRGQDVQGSTLVPLPVRLQEYLQKAITAAFTNAKTPDRLSTLVAASGMQLLSQLHVAFSQQSDFADKLRPLLVTESFVTAILQRVPKLESLFQLQLYALWNTVREPPLAVLALDCGLGRLVVECLQYTTGTAAAQIISSVLQPAGAAVPGLLNSRDHDSTSTQVVPPGSPSATGAGGAVVQTSFMKDSALSDTRAVNMTRRIWAVKVLWITLRLLSIGRIPVPGEKLPILLTDLLVRESREGWICSDNDWDTLYQTRRMLGLSDNQ
ncbi:unnamed protein product [Amoebophrya sp. A120]|nr:unnamed protein product [Amoebophrya sp. A120]|eukprot:GSA120T00001954001.1